jgi:hypothetical protein
MPRSWKTPGALALGVAVSANPCRAQETPWLRPAAQAIGVVSRVDPIPGGGDLTEARIVQPLLMVHAGALQHLRFLATVNLEGATMPDGELVPGAWGEGYNDRRHPHTYAHELVLSGIDLLGSIGGGLRLAVVAGKGFAPFGSDDPMSRPPLRYPVNHHLSQVLERAFVMAGLRAGPVVVEAGLFNGDEPERPDQWPNMDRFGDSWSARLTVLPAAGVELSVSRAKVHSPEHRLGAGSDAWKWHAAARLERKVLEQQLYALVEWAETEEADGFFVFRSWLAEAAWRRGGHRPYYRFERTDRPEDMRTLDLFRSQRPHLENSILGTTRFTIHTAGYQYDWRAPVRGLDVSPFVEGTIGSARNIDGGLLTPEILYRSDDVRSLSAGLRIRWRLAGHRMGRYGSLLDEAHHGAH